MPVRKSAFSNVEHQFILQCVQNGDRLEHRQMLEHRNIKISFGIDHGCCTVDLGKTKVMAQVSCVLDRPKESRPNEGRVNVHVELSTIAYPSFDPTKPGELGITIQRMLEKSLLFSRAIDLEELCVRVGEKVWALHLYVHILSHDGNLVDCSYIAAITALKHFRRPDITVVGQEVIIHSVEEKNPLPLTLHHMPLCISIAFFNDCDTFAVDPSYLEEKVMDGLMMISMNKHREMCGLQMSGEMRVTKEQILRCTDIAYSKIKSISSFIINAIDHDIAAKKDGKRFSVSVYQSDGDSNKQRLQNTMNSENLHFEELSVKETQSDEVESDNDLVETSNQNVKRDHWMTKLGENSSSIGMGNVNKWLTNNDVAVGQSVVDKDALSSDSEKHIFSVRNDNDDEELVTELLDA